jgi:hypothetical protein
LFDDSNVPIQLTVEPESGLYVRYKASIDDKGGHSIANKQVTRL